jgi:hypothetical protein
VTLQRLQSLLQIGHLCGRQTLALRRVGQSARRVCGLCGDDFDLPASRHHFFLHLLQPLLNFSLLLQGSVSALKHISEMGSGVLQLQLTSLQRTCVFGARCVPLQVSHGSGLQRLLSCCFAGAERSGELTHPLAPSKVRGDKACCTFHEAESSLPFEGGDGNALHRHAPAAAGARVQESDHN